MLKILNFVLFIISNVFLLTFYCFVSLVELRRVELLTSCLQGRRSSQLSYSPIHIIIDILSIYHFSINLLLNILFYNLY